MDPLVLVYNHLVARDHDMGNFLADHCMSKSVKNIVIPSRDKKDPWFHGTLTSTLKLEIT